jgi:phosphoribosylglycinamide formyltransferase-1
MIVVLTFDHPHRKTQDLIFNLLAKGITPLIVATEWLETKSFKPIISHRPSNPINISLTEFCNNLNLELVITTKLNLYNELIRYENIDFILLATGNIIDVQIATAFRVINSHPGYLPDIKGLDALKWAILYKQIIGVTTHFINGEIDGGTIIERKIVPVYYEDTFHHVAYRQYEMEVSLLVNSISCSPENIEIGNSDYETFRRMPHRLEFRMLEKFDELRKESEFGTEHLKIVYI